MYGLDDYQGDEFKKEDTHVLVGNKFLPLHRKHDKVSHETINKAIHEFLSKVKHHLISILPLKNTAVLLQDNLDRNPTYCQWSSLALVAIESKIFKPPISKLKEKHLLIFVKFSF